MNVEQLVHEYVEHAGLQRQGGVARMLARRVPRRLRWVRVVAPAVCFAAGVLVGWVTTR